MTNTIGTLSGDPSGDMAGTLEQEGDTIKVRSTEDDYGVIGTLTVAELEAVQTLVDGIFADGDGAEQGDDAPDIEGDLMFGQIEHPLLMLSGHDGLAFMVEGEDEDGVEIPPVLFTAEDILGASAQQAVEA